MKRWKPPAPFLAGSPREGDAAEFLGKPGFWNLVRGPEQYLSWGTYNIKNHLGRGFSFDHPDPAETRPAALADFDAHLPARAGGGGRQSGF